jgi:hypothetical protein
MVDVKTGEPFTLPDGTVIHPGSGEKGNANTIQRKLEIEETDEELVDDVFEGGLSFKRNLADLPQSPSRLNPLMLVLAYHLWGLDATAIAMLLDLQEEQVEAVMCDDMFIAMRKDILEAIRYAETGNIHGYLAQKSLRAARVVVKHMNSKDGDRSLAAAKDILDRSGFRPSDRVEHVHKFEDELRIVYVKEQQMPMIDLNLKEITNGNGS